MNDFKVLVIYKRTTYSQMSNGDKSVHMRTLLKQGDPILDRIILAHKNHESAIIKIREVLIKRGIDAVWRHDFSGLLPDSYDLVITVGGDGTVLHASHSIDNTPILAINSSPDTSTGYFAAGSADNFDTVIEQVISKQMPVHKLYRMEVSINGEPVNSRVLNDVLFSNSCPASTTRYQLGCCNKIEEQISSGIWIATAAGSTAAARGAGGKPMPLESKELQYIVREPCARTIKQRQRRSQTVFSTLPLMTNGIISSADNFFLRSRSDDISLFIDGPHVVIPVKFGDIVTFSSGKSPTYIIGNFLENKT